MLFGVVMVVEEPQVRESIDTFDDIIENTVFSSFSRTSSYVFAQRWSIVGILDHYITFFT